MMVDFSFDIYYDGGKWMLDVYDSAGEAFEGQVPCDSLQEVGRALIDNAEEQDWLDIILNKN